MSVALKDIQGVQAVQVSLSKGEAEISFAPGNTVRYEQLSQAIAKNGFVLKGSSLVAQGIVVPSPGGYSLEISGSNDKLLLRSDSSTAVMDKSLAGKPVEVAGEVGEVAKGKRAEVMEYSAIKLASR